MNLTRPQDPPDGQPIGMDWRDERIGNVSGGNKTSTVLVLGLWTP
jgi:hypothetical protein